MNENRNRWYQYYANCGAVTAVVGNCHSGRVDVF